MSFFTMTYNEQESPISKTYLLKHTKQLDKVFTTQYEVFAFLKFLETDETVQAFLQYDCCYRLADKFLISMVFIYFKRSGINNSYTVLDFFVALSLAHAMEEEDEDLCNEIYPWVLGAVLSPLLTQFQALKMQMWQAMDYRAVVSYYCCTKVMELMPGHWVWRRERSPLHAGAPRDYARSLTPPEEYSEEYDNLTNTCCRCRSMELPLFVSYDADSK